MNWKRIVAAIVLADFTALSAYAVYEVGYVGFFGMMMANIATITVFTDLVIALSMAAIWMIIDARRRGISPTPYLVLTLALGSVGPLAYLVRTLGSESEQSSHVATHHGGASSVVRA
ncbi:MAG: DUF2834 domain-containing protein [Candidatus Binataceae bacterium]